MIVYRVKIISSTRDNMLLDDYLTMCNLVFYNLYI